MVWTIDVLSGKLIHSIQFSDRKKIWGKQLLFTFQVQLSMKFFFSCLYSKKPHNFLRRYGIASEITLSWHLVFVSIISSHYTEKYKVTCVS